MIFAKGAIVFAVLRMALIDSVNCDQWQKMDTDTAVVIDHYDFSIPSWRVDGCARVQSWSPQVYFDLCGFTATYKSAPDLVSTLNAACTYVHPDTIGVERDYEQAK